MPQVREHATTPTMPEQQPSEPNTWRIDWASLLKRVFDIDILSCPYCGGRMRVIAVIEKQDVIEQFFPSGALREILLHVGLPTVPIPFAPAKGQQRLDFDFGC